MNSYRIINLVGKSTYIKVANNDFYNYASSFVCFDDKDINVISTNLNTLESTLKNSIIKNPKMPRLIINSFHTQNEKDLLILNNTTNVFSNYCYENINLNVKKIPNKSRKIYDYLSKHTIYNDIYYIHCTHNMKYKKLKNIFNITIFDGV